MSITTPAGDEFPTCATCGARSVEDAGDHAEATGHWPTPAPDAAAARVHLGDPFPFPACGYLGPDLTPADHLPVIHVTQQRDDATCADCLAPPTAAELAGDVLVLTLERIRPVTVQQRCGYTTHTGTRCISPVEGDGLCTGHRTGFLRLLADLDLPGTRA